MCINLNLAKHFSLISQSSHYNVFVLCLLVTIYIVNQLDRYVLVAMYSSMASDLKIGSRKCAYDISLKKENPESTFGNYSNLMNVSYHTLNEDQMECINTDCEVPYNESVVPKCKWQYTGSGFEYQLLAGPLFLAIFSISGLPLGFMADSRKVNRTHAIIGMLITWSCMTILCGFSKTYWHIAVTRIGLAISQAGYFPLCSSIIKDYFDSKSRGAAMGFFHWGIYIGYSLTFPMILCKKAVGWRLSYVVAGCPGLILALVAMLTLREPTQKIEQECEIKIQENRKKLTSFRKALMYLLRPAFVVLCFGGAVRFGAGNVWAYNVKNYIDTYHPGAKLESYLSWIPLVFGASGALLGGHLSDLLTKKYGKSTRLLVLVGSQVLALPWSIAIFYVNPPWIFLLLIPSVFLGEMWIGVCLTSIIDRVPEEYSASAVTIYIFTFNTFGGLINLLIPPITRHWNLKIALLVTFPFLMAVSVVLFTVAYFMLKCCDNLKLDSIEMKADNNKDLRRIYKPVKTNNGIEEKCDAILQKEEVEI